MLINNFFEIVSHSQPLWLFYKLGENATLIECDFRKWNNLTGKYQLNPDCKFPRANDENYLTTAHWTHEV